MSDARQVVAETAAKIAALPDAAVNAPEDSPQPDTAAAATEQPSAAPEAPATVPGGDTLTPAQWTALESAMPAEQFRGLQQVVKEIGNPWQPAKVQTVLDYAADQFGLSHEEALRELAAIRHPKALIKHYRDAQKWAEERKTPKAPAPAKRASDRPARHQPRAEELRAAQDDLKRSGRQKDAARAVGALLGDRMSTE